MEGKNHAVFQYKRGLSQKLRACFDTIQQPAPVLMYETIDLAQRRAQRNGHARAAMIDLKRKGAPPRGTTQAKHELAALDDDPMLCFSHRHTRHDQGRSSHE